MDIVIANPVKRAVKWAIVGILTALALFFLTWGVREARKPCPYCNGKPVVCSTCQGDGMVYVTKECYKCKGTGKGKVYGKCSVCNGAKTISNSVTCEICNGMKRVRCPRCNK